MRTITFALAALLMFSMAEKASADTILTYTGQDYTTANLTCGVSAPQQQSFCDSTTASHTEYTTSMNLTIQIDLSSTVTLPQTGELDESPFQGSPDVISETVSDGAETIVGSSNDDTNFIALTFSGGNIVGWNFIFATPGPQSYPSQYFTSCFGASCSAPGDSVQQYSHTQSFCGDFFPGAGGDCAALWHDSASTASSGSWSVATTGQPGNVTIAPEPPSLALLAIGLSFLPITLERACRARRALIRLFDLHQVRRQ